MRQISSKMGDKELEDRVYKADQEDRTDKMDKEVVDKTDKVDKEVVGGRKSWKEAMRVDTRVLPSGHKSKR